VKIGQNARRALFRLALRFGKTESGKRYSRVADEAQCVPFTASPSVDSIPNPQKVHYKMRYVVEPCEGVTAHDLTPNEWCFK